jgi:hypothetical protein
MAIIKEFWTNGNLIINSTGGLNFNVLEVTKSWELNGCKLILNKHGRSIEGTTYHPLLEFNIREDKINEVREFFNKHSIKYRVTGE